jgi:hypothetical protein
MGQGTRIAMLALALALAGAPPAAAELRVSGFGGQARWVDTDNPPPGEFDPSVIELSVSGTASGGFDSAASARFTGFSRTLPASSPSYDFRTSASGPSGGSPRLTLRLSNGGAELRPQQVAAGQWTHMDGQSGWDSYGGTCGYRSELSYSQVLECHGGETVFGLEIWNDSGWLYQDGYQVFVDNVTYNGERVSNQDVNALAGPVTPPLEGESVAASPEDGTVLVRLPDFVGSGRFVPLEEGADVPVGSVVDTTCGEVQLQSDLDSSRAVQSGSFSDGVFRIIDPVRPEDAGITELRLRGGLGPCPGPEARAASLVRRFHSDVRRRRRFRSSGSSAAASAKAPVGGYRIRARYSTATAQDAVWDTFDRSDGTFTRVTRGRVVVQDLNHDRTVVLRAGGRHLARP